MTETSQACASCSVYQTANLKKLGVDASKADFVVALAGNPNTGKSTIFNALTGLRQHVGNWSGKTVARAEGAFSYAQHTYKLVDLPGTYSLLSTSTDEEVARDFLLFGKPHATIVVLDATRLERNLNLALQILEITPKVVVALNLMDEAKRHGIDIDIRQLSRDLAVPVVAMSARSGTGIPELIQTVAGVAHGEIQPQAVQRTSYPSALQHAIHSLSRQLEQAFPNLANSRWVAMRLLEGDNSMTRAVQDGTLGTL